MAQRKQHVTIDVSCLSMANSDLPRRLKSVSKSSNVYSKHEQPLRRGEEWSLLQKRQIEAVLGAE